MDGSDALDAATCAAVERAISPLVDVGFCFSGVRLFCEPDSFLDCAQGDVRKLLTGEDSRADLLQRRWGGPVFGQFVSGDVVSWAAVKPLSDVVWDLSIETLPERPRPWLREGLQTAAVKHIFASGRLAGWGCDRTSVESLGSARAVGFRDYGFDLVRRTRPLIQAGPRTGFCRAP